jgi:arsenite methyltransferase
MTDEQIEVAKRHVEYHREAFGFEKANTEFKKGVIEDLKGSAGIDDETIDCVISNCVINLSDDKEKVFKEIWRVLKPGGELYFSDVYSDRRIPEHLRQDKVLWGECLSGALYIEDFRRMMARVGFNYYYTAKQSAITVDNPALEA